MMAELTAEEARRLSRIVPSVPIDEYVKKIDNAILEATKKGRFEIPAWECLGPWTLTDAEVRAIKSHYENNGFEFVLMETILSWNEVREMPEPATESNDATSDREALVEYLGSINING